MKIKITENILGAAALVVLIGFISNSVMAQPVVPVGKTEMQSSQLILWYDNDDIDEDRFSLIQVTNASNDTPVWVHVQVFASTCLDFDDTVEDDCAPGAVVLCAETNFNDFFTPNDTHVYTMDEVHRNDPLNQDPVVADFDGTKGFVVVTPIDAPGTRNAIAHQHMFGNSFVFDDGEGLTWGVNATGRDAVSFSTGNVVADGAVLDGVSSGYILIQPEILKFNFVGSLTLFSDADIVSIAFRDNYEGVFGYVAEPGDAVWTPLIFDDAENPISCSAIPQNCFFNVGVNDDMDPNNDLLGNDISLCPNSSYNDVGWMKIAVSGLEGLENELGLAAFTRDTDLAFATWMYAEGAATAVEPPPECTVDADCAEGEVCEAEECVPEPECTSDADCSGDEVCSPAGDCVECNVDAECAEGEVCQAGACIVPPECTVDADCSGSQVCDGGVCTGGGGGGGCAIASTASAGSAAANALVLLIPLLGIGLRSMLRRKEED